mmetsp:Transcript_99720/g.310086  ORF Transcript_99720/g.310086 Transcript_99720/m.310086 type:complete len:123 (+) Transcript_99720:65-433(+)
MQFLRLLFARIWIRIHELRVTRTWAKMVTANVQQVTTLQWPLASAMPAVLQVRLCRHTVWLKLGLPPLLLQMFASAGRAGNLAFETAFSRSMTSANVQWRGTTKPSGRVLAALWAESARKVE